MAQLYTGLPSERVRVLVLGDSGVGKSSVVHYFSHEGEVLANPRWTLGCNADVRFFSHGGHEVACEFLEVGGAPRYKMSNGVFFTDFHGLIFVHDVTNFKSRRDLKGKLYEAMSEAKRRMADEDGSAARAREEAGNETAAGQLSQSFQRLRWRVPDCPVSEALGVPVPPMLVIGNKTDAGISPLNHKKLLTAESSDVHHMLMSATAPTDQYSHLAAQMDQFLQAVVDNRFSTNLLRSEKSRRHSQHQSSQDARRSDGAGGFAHLFQRGAAIFGSPADGNVVPPQSPKYENKGSPWRDADSIYDESLA